MFIRGFVVMVLLVTGVAIAPATAGPVPAEGVTQTPAVTATPVVAAVPAGVSGSVVTAARPRAKVSGSYRVLSTGKVRVTVRSNARKVRLTYKTIGNRPAAITVTLRRGVASTTLAKGSKSIRAQALATTRLRASAVVTLPRADTTPPRKVTGLKVTAATPTTISLAWTNPTDRDLATVIVRRAKGSIPPATATAGTRIRLASPKPTRVTDTKLTPDTGYAYAVFTRDKAGNTGRPTTLTSRTTPAPDPNAPTVAAVDAGADHMCALLTGGTIKCWGDNWYGQLGDGTTTDRATPVAVSGISGASAITTGWGHSCALLTGGTIQCWGHHRYGQLGNGDRAVDDWSTPVAVSGISDATAITAHGDHSCALLTGGTIQCWGYNRYGQLGDGTTFDRFTPVPVTGISGATAITAGAHHMCALLPGGVTSCWGWNDYGQLGDGTSITRYSPGPVAGFSGATAITAGYNHTCALQPGGTIKCSGWNHHGLLGDGTTITRFTPVPVTGISGATAITAGGNHTCALLPGGTIKCWGYNGWGQLGDGTTTTRLTPVAVVGMP